jgi:hypothetical protein
MTDSLSSFIPPTNPAIPGPLSPRERRIVAIAKVQLPSIFLGAYEDKDDIKLLEYIKLALDLVNNTTPATCYTINDMPECWDRIIVFGATQLTTLFLQLGWALNDFNYSDNGLSLNLDRVQKLDTPYKNLMEQWKSMVQQLKYQEVFRIGGRGIATPRFQTQIGQFLKLALGASFNWNTTG